MFDERKNQKDLQVETVVIKPELFLTVCICTYLASCYGELYRFLQKKCTFCACCSAHKLIFAHLLSWRIR